MSKTEQGVGGQELFPLCANCGGTLGSGDKVSPTPCECPTFPSKQYAPEDKRRPQEYEEALYY